MSTFRRTGAACRAGEALHCLLCAYGVYAQDRHRALADREAGVWLLARQPPVSDEFVLGVMRWRSLTLTVRLWAIRSPFEMKEALRARGATLGCPKCGTEMILPMTDML